MTLISHDKTDFLALSVEASKDIKRLTALPALKNKMCQRFSAPSAGI